jgi:WD40 repeat protein
LKKHEELVERIVFSPDGSILASEEQFDFSADGQTLVTLNMAGPFINTIFYHVDTGAEKQVKSLGMNDVEFISSHYTTFYRNNFILATRELDHAINLWDLVKGVHKKTLRGQRGSNFSLAFSSNGKTIAAVDSTVTIYLWDTDTSVQKKFRTGHATGVLSVAFSPDGKRIAAGDMDGTVYVLDAVSGITQQRFTGHEGEVKIVAFASDRKVVVSLSDKGVILLWDVK